MAGAARRAWLKSSVSLRSLSPRYCETRADMLTVKKEVWKHETSDRTNRVFPEPGGPYNKTPFGTGI